MLRGLAAVVLLSVPTQAADPFDGSPETAPSSILQKVSESGGSVPEVGASGIVTFNTPPSAGHGAASETFDSAIYDIWVRNCHTQANLFAAHAYARGLAAGVLACQGDPESSPAYHTAAWALEAPDRTCIYNYGMRCCWPAGSSTPDIASGQGQACAKWACGGQYDPAQTRALPPGQLIESPSPHACAIEAAGGPPNLLSGMALTALTERFRTRARTVRVPSYPTHPEGAELLFTPERLEPCLKCCGSRADMWSGEPSASATPALAKGREDAFRRQCVTACRNSFGSAP